MLSILGVQGLGLIGGLFERPGNSGCTRRSVAMHCWSGRLLKCALHPSPGGRGGRAYWEFWGLIKFLQTGKIAVGGVVCNKTFESGCAGLSVRRWRLFCWHINSGCTVGELLRRTTDLVGHWKCVLHLSPGDPFGR
jgi:hypothetical protein